MGIINYQTRNSLVDSSSTSEIAESSAISKPMITASSSENSVDALKEKNHSKQFTDVKKHLQDQQVEEESEYSVRTYHDALRQNTLKTQSTIASLPSLFDLLRASNKSE